MTEGASPSKGEKNFSIKTRILLILLLALSVFVSYSKSLSNGFFYDDRNLITENPLVVNHEYSRIWRTDLFETTRGSSQYYRPLVVFMFALEYLFFRDNAGLYHLVNIILHFLCVLILLKFTEIIFSRFKIDKKHAFLPAFLFALHPANSQAVYWIAARGDIMMTAGILGGALSFLSNKKISFLFVPLTFALAILSKELGLIYLVLVPPAVFILEKKTSKKEFSLKYAVLIPLLIAYFLVRTSVVKQGFVFNSEETFWRPEYGHMKRLLTVPSIWGYYLLRAFSPFFLNFESGIELFRDFFRPQFLFGLLSVAGTAAAVFLRRKDRFFMLFFLFWTVSLLPVLNIFPIFESGMEHYMYLPMTAFCVFFGGIFRGGKIRMALFVVLCSVFSLTVFFRGNIWKDEKSIWLDSAKKTAVYARHGWIRSRTNLASSLISESEAVDSSNLLILRAESLYIEVKMEYSDYSGVNAGLGNICLLRGEYDSALVYISASVNDNPGNYFLLNKLAYIYSALGDNDMALSILEKVREMKPDYDEANANLAVLYFLRNNFERSYALYLSTEMTPRNEKVMKNLGMAFSVLRGEEINGFVPEMMDAVKLLGDAGLFEEKYTLLKIMTEQRPDNPDILFDLALCAALDLGEVQASLSVFDLGIKIFPEDSRFLRGKGLLYLSLGDTANSILIFEEYIEKFPKDSFHSDISEFLEKIKNQPI